MDYIIRLYGILLFLFKFSFEFIDCSWIPIVILNKRHNTLCVQKLQIPSIQSDSNFLKRIVDFVSLFSMASNVYSRAVVYHTAFSQNKWCSCMMYMLFFEVEVQVWLRKTFHGVKLKIFCPFFLKTDAKFWLSHLFRCVTLTDLRL